MKVFISWSGDASHVAAKALKRWLPNVFQAIKEKDVFLSSWDVALGADWFHELGEVLEASDFGVLCLTRDNLAAPWVLFEAGAISKRLDSARVAPLLIGVTREEVTPPLSHFQGAVLDREGAERLMRSINERLEDDDKLTDKQLDSALNAYWLELETAVREAAAEAFHPPGKSKYTYDVFLSAPMAAYPDDAAYVAARAGVAKLFEALQQGCGLRTYWAAEKIEHIADFDTIDVSVLDDIRALQESRFFVLVYTEKLASSALFEAGYALARDIPSHYFVRERDDLPFLLRELPGSTTCVRIHTRGDWKDYDDLARKLKRNKERWFPAGGRFTAWGA